MSNFLPNSKLKRVNNTIVKIEHPLRGEIDYFVIDDEKLRKLVNRVIKWKDDKIEAQVKLMETEEISQLADYVVINRFNVPTQNIIKVLTIAGTESDFMCVMKDWQDCYAPDEIRNLLLKAITDGRLYADLTQKSIKKNVAHWIEHENILFHVVDMIDSVDSKKEYREKLIGLGVIDNSKLYIDCFAEFYLCCSGKAYLESNQNSLKTAFRDYEDEEKKIRFVVNLLGKLELKELEHLKELYELISVELERPSLEKKFSAMLSKHKLLDKYINWGRLIKVKLLGDAERVNFWEQYITVADDMDDKNEVLYMVFKNVTVTEFLGKGAGPAYFFKNEYFERQIKRKIGRWAKQKLQNHFYGLWDSGTGYNETFVGDGRIEHRGEWTWEVARLLKKVGVEPD